MNKNNPKGVRKGAWSKEEDILLKNCVEKYGEGKWHLLPVRAGLNRCRKSCWLRWLNYLRPNIKRGKFSEDEIDLIIRLQKLLGNRWSLIAGRLPGRTANDVKNLWNARLEKKNSAGDHSVGKVQKGQVIIQEKITKSNIIRPRPWTFSKDCPRIGIGIGNGLIQNEVKNANTNYDHDQQQSSSVPNIQDEFSIRNWWSDLLESTIRLAKDEKQIIPYSNDDDDNSNNPRKDYVVKQINNPVGLDDGDDYCTTPNINGFSNYIDQADYNGVNPMGLNYDNPMSIQKGLSEFPFHCDIWELLDSNDMK